MSCLEDLPNELLLIICRYLSPTEVLNGFLQYSSRTSQCISDYSLRLNLTNYSYGDVQYILMEFINQRLLPSSLLVSNRMIPNQIGTFFSSKLTANMARFGHVHQLSLLGCNDYDMSLINWYVNIFPCLHSLRIAQHELAAQYSMSYSTHALLCGLIFDMKFAGLANITLTTNEGIILSKQLCPNTVLRRLAITLRTIDDLLVLLDGLVPNLIELHATLCTARASREMLVPFGFSTFSMVHLTKFRLTTNEHCEMQLEYLLNVVKPLTQLGTLQLDVKQWTSSDYMLPPGDQIESIFDEFLPRLQYFYCSIRTMCGIDMTVKLMESV